MAKTVSYSTRTYNVTVPSAGTDWVKVFEATDVDNDFVTILIANTGTAQVNVQLTLTESATAGDGSGGSLLAYILYNVPIPDSSTLTIDNEVIHLDRGQQLWVKSSSNSISLYGKMVREVKTIN